MLEIINCYAHEFVAVPVIIACKKKGLFELLVHRSYLSVEKMVNSLGANRGAFQAALRLLESLNWLSKNELGKYCLTEEASIHYSIPPDILALYHIPIEDKCWPKPLQASSSEIRQRLEKFPDGNCLLETDSTSSPPIDGQIVGVIYSQRISSNEFLENATYQQLTSRNNPQGSIVQLLGINVLPEFQNRGLGNELRDFMLQYCTLKGGIDRLVGVTRWKWG